VARQQKVEWKPEYREPADLKFVGRTSLHRLLFGQRIRSWPILPLLPGCSRPVCSQNHDLSIWKGVAKGEHTDPRPPGSTRPRRSLPRNHWVNTSRRPSWATAAHGAGGR
jgi:hypothetical protein